MCVVSCRAAIVSTICVMFMICGKVSFPPQSVCGGKEGGGLPPKNPYQQCEMLKGWGNPPDRGSLEGGPKFVFLANSALFQAILGPFQGCIHFTRKCKFSSPAVLNPHIF